MTGVGYNDVGDVVCRGRKVSETGHPSILKIVEVNPLVTYDFNNLCVYSPFFSISVSLSV